MKLFSGPDPIFPSHARGEAIGGPLVRCNGLGGASGADEVRIVNMSSLEASRLRRRGSALVGQAEQEHKCWHDDGCERSRKRGSRSWIERNVETVGRTDIVRRV
jgi:hypothetical protein